MSKLSYHDHPESPEEDHKTFKISVTGMDYIISIIDEKTHKGLHFRFCLSGGFESKYPKTTEAVAALYRALAEEGVT